jgi:hypothetical protein
VPFRCWFVIIAGIAGVLAAAAFTGAAPTSGSRAAHSALRSAAYVSVARSCSTTRFYGTARITVRRTRRISCRRAAGRAKAAVVYRERHGFPKRFCHGGWCWRFGEFRGRGEGNSVARFHGRSGRRRIRATEVVA